MSKKVDEVAGAKPDASRGSPKFEKKKDNVWTMFFNLGAFLAGAAAGYFFSKAEQKFTVFGEEMAYNMIRSLRKGKGDGGGEGESRFRPHIVPDRSERFSRGSEFDPMGDRVGSFGSQEDI